MLIETLCQLENETKCLKISSYKRLPKLDFLYYSDITDLTIEFNNLKEIPNEIRNLNSLRKLLLNNNDLKEIPKPIYSIKTLEHIDFSFNRIKTIGQKICQLQNLKILILRKNCLTSINANLFLIPSLTTLDVSFNNIMSIPNSLCFAKNLIDFSVSFNPLDYQLLKHASRGHLHLIAYLKQQMINLKNSNNSAFRDSQEIIDLSNDLQKQESDETAELLRMDSPKLNGSQIKPADSKQNISPNDSGYSGNENNEKTKIESEEVPEVPIRKNRKGYILKTSLNSDALMNIKEQNQLIDTRRFSSQIEARFPKINLNISDHNSNVERFRNLQDLLNDSSSLQRQSKQDLEESQNLLHLNNETIPNVMNDSVMSTSFQDASSFLSSMMNFDSEPIVECKQIHQQHGIVDQDIALSRRLIDSYEYFIDKDIKEEKIGENAKGISPKNLIKVNRNNILTQSMKTSRVGVAMPMMKSHIINSASFNEKFNPRKYNLKESSCSEKNDLTRSFTLNESSPNKFKHCSQVPKERFTNFLLIKALSRLETIFENYLRIKISTQSQSMANQMRSGILICKVINKIIGRDVIAKIHGMSGAVNNIPLLTIKYRQNLINSRNVLREFGVDKNKIFSVTLVLNAVVPDGLIGLAESLNFLHEEMICQRSQAAQISYDRSDSFLTPNQRKRNFFIAEPHIYSDV